MKKLLMMIVLSIILTTNALAYSAIWRIDTNMPAGSRVYECVGNVCSPGTINQVSELSGISMNHALSGNGNPDRYAVFTWPEDACAVPKAFHNDVSQSALYVSPVDFSVQPQETCGSNVVNEWLSENNVAPGTTVSYTAWLEHAWWFSDPEVVFWPTDLNDFWKSVVNVRYYVNDNLVGEEQVNILMNDHWYHAGFDFTPTEPGIYTLRIETDMNDDCKCAGSNTKSVETRLVVTQNEVPEFTLVSGMMLTALAGLFIFIKRR